MDSRAEPPFPRQRTAPMQVDQDHPFFFDHPLDHVPGMLLVAQLLDLARVVAPGTANPWPGRRLKLALDFPRFCELDLAAAMHLTADPATAGPDLAGDWRLLAEQSGR